MSATLIVPARVIANRRNAQRSTGPKTAEGKARARANAVRHGLTGAGVALAGEDQAAIEAEFIDAQEDLAPTTHLGARLVRRAALLAVRLDRCERYAQALDEQRMRHAVAHLDRSRAEHADRLVDAIEADPRAVRRALLATPEGVDRLCAGLHMLLGELAAAAPAWSDAHHKRIDALFGFRVADIPWGRPTRFSRALLGDFEAIGDAEIANVAEDERGGWALEQLVAAIRTELASLTEYRATMDHAALLADRLAAPDLALFDPNRPAELARRYELATTRELARTLRDFHLVETLAAPVADEAQPEPVAPEPESVATHLLEPQPNLISHNDIDPMASFGERAFEPALTPVRQSATPPGVASSAELAKIARSSAADRASERYSIECIDRGNGVGPPPSAAQGVRLRSRHGASGAKRGMAQHGIA